MLLLSSFLLLFEFHHGLTHGLSNIHVRFGIVIVVGARAAALGQRVCVDGHDVAVQVGILFRITNVHHGVKDLATARGVVAVHWSLAQRGANEFGVGCIELGS